MVVNKLSAEESFKSVHNYNIPSAVFLIGWFKVARKLYVHSHRNKQIKNVLKWVWRLTVYNQVCTGWTTFNSWSSGVSTGF